jgi:hypothetical protein
MKRTLSGFDWEKPILNDASRVTRRCSRETRIMNKYFLELIERKTSILEHYAGGFKLYIGLAFLE